MPPQREHSIQDFQVGSFGKSVKKQSTLKPQLEILEDRTVPASFRTIDGISNYLNNNLWGSAGVELLRISPAEYGDGVSAPAGTDRPSAREISNALVDQGYQDVISDRNLSAMIYAWGQFIDHDLDLSVSGSESFNIAVPTGDSHFDPEGTGTKVIGLKRSVSSSSSGTGIENPREQTNVVTAWLDGSQIYGSDNATALKLRTLIGGRLKTSPGNDGVIGTGDDLLPYNSLHYFPTGILAMANDAHLVSDDRLFAAGDVRANENIELTSLHTIFVREHNRIATALHRAYPNWSDETLYQNARARLIAELQVITYKEWLPALLGNRALSVYRGYNSNVNPGIANEFSTAAFRFGHSLLGDDVEFLDNNGNEIADAIPLSQAFSNPELLTTNGVDSILKYLSSDPASELDLTIVGSVRNFLFGPPGAGGFDLASLNIQRGRDHGLADYNTIRVSYGLPKVTSFAQITLDSDVQDKLEQLYGSVDNIDAWIGALAEDHVAGTSVGPLIQKVVADQFRRLRDADRFWYQLTFSGRTLRELENTSLANVIKRNTTLTNLQINVFVFSLNVSGAIFVDQNRNGRFDWYERSIAGIAVELIDSNGDIVATTFTDWRGIYRLDIKSGLRLGSYEVYVVPPAGKVPTTPGRQFTLTRGDQTKRNVNLGLTSLVNPSSSSHILAPILVSATRTDSSSLF